jgi:hypothetical protein
MVTREHDVSIGQDQAPDLHVPVVGGIECHTAQALEMAGSSGGSGRLPSTCPHQDQAQTAPEPGTTRTPDISGSGESPRSGQGQGGCPVCVRFRETVSRSGQGPRISPMELDRLTTKQAAHLREHRRERARARAAEARRQRRTVEFYLAEDRDKYDADWIGH